MVDQVKRIQHGPWYVQSRPSPTGGFTAWASEEPTDGLFHNSKGDIYFDFGTTEDEAVQKVTTEIDTLQPRQTWVVRTMTSEEAAQIRDQWEKTREASSVIVIELEKRSLLHRLLRFPKVFQQNYCAMRPHNPLLASLYVSYQLAALTLRNYDLTS